MARCLSLRPNAANAECEFITRSQQPTGPNVQPSPRGDISAKSLPSSWAKDAPEIVPQVVVAVEHYNRIVRMLQKKTPVQLGDRHCQPLSR